MTEKETEQQKIWDVTPQVVSVELTDGKMKMSERAIYNGRLRVHKAIQMGSTPDPDCANLYITAESRNGADVELDLDQAKELRDALDECIQQTVKNIEDSELEVDVSAE